MFHFFVAFVWTISLCAWPFQLFSFDIVVFLVVSFFFFTVLNWNFSPSLCWKTKIGWYFADFWFTMAEQQFSHHSRHVNASTTNTFNVFHQCRSFYDFCIGRIRDFISIFFRWSFMRYLFHKSKHQLSVRHIRCRLFLCALSVLFYSSSIINECVRWNTVFIRTNARTHIAIKIDWERRLILEHSRPTHTHTRNCVPHAQELKIFNSIRFKSMTFDADIVWNWWKLS